MDGWKTILSFWVSAYVQGLWQLVSGSLLGKVCLVEKLPLWLTKLYKVPGCQKKLRADESCLIPGLINPISHEMFSRLLNLWAIYITIPISGGAFYLLPSRSLTKIAPEKLPFNPIGSRKKSSFFTGGLEKTSVVDLVLNWDQHLFE